MKQKHKSPTTAQDILAWSMDCYRALSTFQAHCQVTVSSPGDAPTLFPGSLQAYRQIQYAKPNRYRIVSELQNDFQSKGVFVASGVSMAICNGRQEVDASFAQAPDSQTVSHQPRQIWQAPTSIAEARSDEMTAPLLSGSLLYKFFRGRSYLRALVDKARAPIRLLTPLVWEDHPCHVVSFHAREAIYGQVEVAISAQDGLVRHLRYDMEPHQRQMMQQLLVEWQSGRLKKMVQEEHGEFKGNFGEVLAFMEVTPPSLNLGTEAYSRILVNAPLASELFDAPPGRIEAQGA